MIKVSVIIPVYNTAKYLKKCLNSAVHQTLKDIEIICINDGSTDNSLNILQEYAKKDKRIKIISKENEGLSVARNVGIEASSGEFIGFLDSDDWICFDYFEKLYETATLYNADIAVSSIRRLGFCHNSHKLYYDTISYITDTQEKIDVSGVPSRNYVWNKIYRLEKFRQLNFKFIKGMYFEDIDLSIRLISEMGSMVTVPKIAYFYRMRPHSIVSKVSKSPKKINDFYITTANCLKYANKNNIKPDSCAAYPKKKIYKFLGICFLKVYNYSKTKTVYKVFGFIPILSINKA